MNEVSFCAQFLCPLQHSIASTGKDHLGAELCHELGGGKANAAGTAGAGDECGRAFEAKRGGIHLPSLGSQP